MQNAVFNKIRLLKHIKPNPDWLKNQRNILLSEISQSGKKTRFSRLMARQVWSDLPGFLIPVFKPARLLARPVLISGVVLGLIFGGGFLTVQAAKTALSGDLLYPVKIAIENARLKVSSQENKPKFQAELINIRIQEITQIIEGTDNPATKKEQITKTVDKLQAQVVSAKAGLDKIKQAEPQKVVDTINAVSETSAQSEKALIEAKEKIVEGLKDEESQDVVSAIDAAVKGIKETSSLAAEIKEEKTGTSVQMEVKEIEPQLEKFNEASASFEEIK